MNGVVKQRMGIIDKMPIIFQKRIYREDLKANPGVIYIFGDNDQRKGLGGQAKEMRGEPNALGIRTKKSPHNYDSSFYSDNELKENMEKIKDDFWEVGIKLVEGYPIVWPLDGIGTGLSEMNIRCPKTWEYLLECRDYLFSAWK